MIGNKKTEEFIGAVCIFNHMSFIIGFISYLEKKHFFKYFTELSFDQSAPTYKKQKIEIYPDLIFLINSYF